MATIEHRTIDPNYWLLGQAILQRNGNEYPFVARVAEQAKDSVLRTLRRHPVAIGSEFRQQISKRTNHFLLSAVLGGLAYLTATFFDRSSTSVNDTSITVPVTVEVEVRSLPFMLSKQWVIENCDYTHFKGKAFPNPEDSQLAELICTNRSEIVDFLDSLKEN